MSFYNLMNAQLVLKLPPIFFFMARPKGLRFTSEKIDSNFSHRFQILLYKLNLTYSPQLRAVSGEFQENMGWKDRLDVFNRSSQLSIKLEE